MYRLLSKEARNKGNSYVLFRITERVQRICIWVNQNFLLEEELDIESEETKELHISLLCLRDQSYLYMDFGADGQVRFSTHDIRLAGDLIQSLAVYLNLSELQVKTTIKPLIAQHFSKLILLKQYLIWHNIKKTMYCT